MKSLKSLFHKQEFNPGFISLFINPFYFARKGLYQHISELARNNIIGRILDVGCGSKPYLSLFPYHEYIGMELEGGNSGADCYYTGNKFPFKDEEFDSVITSQVLEHVPAPDVFLSEIHRILKGGGILLLTVPFIWDEHEQPHDYARYSSFGLVSLLEKNGFIVIQHRKSMTGIRAVFQMLNVYTYKKTATENHYLNVIKTFFLIAPFNILGEIAGYLFPGNNDLYLDNIILARRKKT